MPRKAVEQKDPGSNNAARDALHSFARRMHKLCDEGDEITEQKAGLRAEVKAFGLSPKALMSVVRKQRMDQQKREEEEMAEELYRSILE